MTLSRQQVEFFHENGYLIAGELLNQSEVSVLREKLDAALRGDSDTSGKVEYAATIENVAPADGGVLQVVNIWKQMSAFRKHHSHPRLVSMAKQLTGSDTVRLFHDQILSKPARNGRCVAWHQDYGYWRMVAPADLITCWVALDEATVANGCMEVIPGSHKWGLLEAETNLAAEPDALLGRVTPPPGAKVERVACTLPPGHCMWHHCLTLHGSGPNTTDCPRRAVITHLMPGHCYYDARFAHLMAQYAEAEKIADKSILRGANFPEL